MSASVHKPHLSTGARLTLALRNPHADRGSRETRETTGGPHAPPPRLPHRRNPRRRGPPPRRQRHLRRRPRRRQGRTQRPLDRPTPRPGRRPGDDPRPPRRDGVLVLHPGTPSTAFLSAAFDAGATRVVCLPDDTPWLSGALADAAESTPGRTGPVIAVVGGSGGAGASIFATTLALTSINAGTPALLIDCDPLSGGLDLVLGTESKEGLRWPDIPTTTGRVSATKLKQALPGRAKNGTRLTLLSGTHTGEGPAPDAVEAVIAAGRRTGDTVICDLPRHPTPAMRTALSAANLVAVVVQADVRSCAAAHRITTDLRHHGVRLGVVVRGPSPSKLSPQEIAQTLATPS
ncbi:septum site-determining protein Ssd [Actinokineospora soli]|uniref:Septum site-determining protein Ssd n=1 Tax=Actinokineospora soli TaxID=1048753 RepID=A0ABW2TFI9_9PSEU